MGGSCSQLSVLEGDNHVAYVGCEKILYLKATLILMRSLIWEVFSLELFFFFYPLENKVISVAFGLPHIKI